MTTPTAAPCLDCRTKGGIRPKNQIRPRRTQGYCATCYQRHWRAGDIDFGPQHGGWANHAAPPHPEVPTGIVTIAMLGIKPGQPPTDPALTPKMVRAIGNLNARRATAWLKAHGHTGLATLATTIWEPATDDAERRAA